MNSVVDLFQWENSDGGEKLEELYATWVEPDFNVPMANLTVDLLDHVSAHGVSEFLVNIWNEVPDNVMVVYQYYVSPRGWDRLCINCQDENTVKRVTEMKLMPWYSMIGKMIDYRMTCTGCKQRWIAKILTEPYILLFED